MDKSTKLYRDEEAQQFPPNFPLIPMAPFKLNRKQDNFPVMFESQKTASVYSEKHESQASNYAHAKEELATNRKHINMLVSDQFNASESFCNQQSNLSKTSFDMPLSQVIKSQTFKRFRRPETVQNPLPSKAACQYVEVPPAPDRDAQRSFLDTHGSQHANLQLLDNEPFQKASTIAEVQNHKLKYKDDEPFKITENPSVGGVQLRSVKEIPRNYQDIFNFPYFNILQSLVFDEVFYTDKSIVASSPTGSGKTVIFELALIRLLTKIENSGHRGKIVYMAPMKALCTERYQDWTSKFSCYGLSCLEITGDSELDDFGELLKADLICTTPEKWDSMSRRWRDNKSLFHQIQLFLIDEIHILNDPSRGATVEAVVSRMKTLQTASAGENYIRFVAVSATMPNYDDIAKWLGTTCKPAAAFNLGEKFRPVKLDRIVLGYPFKEGTSDFRFDMNLSYRLKGIIESYSHGKPTLVFCSSRKSVVQTAEALSKGLRVRTLLINYAVDVLQRAANCVHEHKLSELLMLGIGIHHAGMDIRDRHTIEELFRTSQLPVLISTSTLAMGVNLPAHLVIVKSTHFYNMGVVQEYSDMQILQMIGRAGRPQFDTSATAVIMTKIGLKSKYESLIKGTQLIESSLHKNLIEHLNAEIVLQTISEMSLVVEWIRHTFLYVRVMKNPKYYDLCQQSLNRLSSLNLVSINDETSAIFPTSTGRLMARYCIAYETMKQFHNIGDDQGSIADMLTMMSQCTEFEDIQLRINEKKILNSFNRDKNRETIRFPMSGKIKTRQMKVNCLIQAQLSCLPVQDFSLSQDMAKIFRVGQRIAKCLMEFMYQRSSYSALLHAILIYKAFKCKLWFDSRYVARQLDGIGPAMSLALANSGLTSFPKLEQASPREIELIVNRHPPFGNQIKETVAALPRYELVVEQVKCYKPNKAVLILSVDLLNRSILEERPSSHNSHQSLLIVGDGENNLIFKWRISDSAILREGGLSQTLEVRRSKMGTKLNISLLSQDWVGLDIHLEYEPVYSEGWFETVRLQQNQKGQTPASKLNQAMQLGKMKAPLNSSVLPVTPLGKSHSTCNHKCLDKTMCAHKCCKSSFGKRTPPPPTETPHEKIPRKENSLLRENKDIKEMFHIVEERSSLKNKPRLSMTRDPGFKTVTPGQPTVLITPNPVPGISVPDFQEDPGVFKNTYVCDNHPIDVDDDDFMVDPIAPCFSRMHQTGQGEHLQERMLYEEKLPSFQGSSVLDSTADGNVELDVGNNVWTTTTSSDEELCQIADTNIMPPADEKARKNMTYQSSSPNVKKMPFDHIENSCEIFQEGLDNEFETEEFTNFDATSELTEHSSCRNHGLLNSSSPNVISLSDSDSVILISSPENQFETFNTNCKSPVPFAGQRQSATPALETSIDPLSTYSCRENDALEILKSGQISDKYFTDVAQNDGKTSSQQCHRYGRVHAWKKDTSKTSFPHESVTKPGCGMSQFFVPKERT